jgi:uncharacterized protein
MMKLPLVFRREAAMENRNAPGNTIEITELRPLAVVTGASSGIGYALAKVFAENGFDLVIAAENPGIVDAGNAFRTLGVNVETVQVDLSTDEGVDLLYQKIKSLGKHVHSIAINAGVGLGGEFIKTDLKREMNMVRLNVISTMHLAKHVLRDMVAHGSGRVLFTSSVAAEMPGPYFAVYAATKAFIQSFSEALRLEVKDSGVSITALQPGPTDTGFFERANMLETKAARSKKDQPFDVAEEAFDALMAGRDHVVPGSFMNKVQASFGKIASKPQGAAMQGRQTKPEPSTKTESSLPSQS